MTPHRFRIFTGLLCAAAIPFAASAADSVDAKKADDKNDEPVKLESVEVTGTRLRSLVGEQSAIPVLTFDQIELEQRGVSRLADIRWAIPQLGPSVGFNDNLQNSGTSRAQTVSTSFALRGVSGNSTLVLIDGHRVPHTGQEAPGGAGGREDFNIDGIPVSAIERIEVLPQGAGAIYGSDAITGVVNIILKKNFKGAELQFTYDNTFDTDVAAKTVSLTGGYRVNKLSLFYTVSQTDQDSLAARDRWWSKSNDLTPYGASYNNNIYSPYTGAGTLASGFYPYGSATLYSLPSGTKGTFTTGQATAGASAPLYDAAAYATLIDPSRSRSVVLKADFDYASWLRPYAQVRYNDFRAHYTGTPNTLFRQLAANANGNPFNSALYLAKVFYDLPSPTTTSEQKNAGLVLGADGELPGDWRYDTSFSWARNIVSDDARNNGFDYAKTTAALASGAILTYDSSTPGTDPNAAGLVQSLLATSQHKDTTDVYEYSAQANGTVWTGWAGDVRAAIGGEFQREKVRFTRTPAISYVLSAPFQRDVSAAFAELAVPLLSDRQNLPIVHRLEVTGAARSEHFSDLGNHTSPAVNALYQPFKWLTFRAARTAGFKAPTLYNLLAPNYATTTTLTASRGIVDTQRGNAPVVGTFALTAGGQPHLKPETSVSRNAGVVFDVPSVAGLSFSVDFWMLDYNDQVSTPGYQDLITFFPERITRDAAGVITGFDDSVINQSKVNSRGVDYRLTYEHGFSFGRLMLSASATDEGDLTAIATPSSKPSRRKMPAKGSAALFWNQGPWTAGVAVNYQSRYQPYAGAAAYYPAYHEWNPQVAYDFGHAASHAGVWGQLIQDTKLSVTIINLFNREPDDWAVGNGRIVMDPRLRRYVLTLTKKF